VSASLPWYAALVGQRGASADLERLVREFELVETRSGRTRFLENERRGISVVFDGKELGGIHHLSEEIEGCARFAGPLPLGLEFAYAREAVERVLGPCDHDTGPRSGNVWRYDRGACWVAISFSVRTGCIESITLESRASAAKLMREVDAL
jgi:hypothetical protein